MKTDIKLCVVGLLAWVLLPVVTGCANEQTDDRDHGHAHDAAHDHDHSVEEHNQGGDVHEHDGPAAHEHGDEAADAHDHGDASRIVLSDTAARNIGLRTRTIRPQVYYDQIKIPGMVTVDPDQKFEISAPATVRVVKLDARVPAAVRPGERLALLELVDPEIRNLQMEAAGIGAQLLEDATEQKRITRYLESLDSETQSAVAEIERVSANLRVLEARLAARQSALDGLLAALRTAGLRESQLRALADNGRVSTHIIMNVPTTTGITSLEVVDRPVHHGQTVEAGTTLYTLVGLEELWVMGEAFEADLGIVRRAARDDLPVTILFPAEDHQVTDLRIEALEGELDGANRVTHFFVRLPNRRMEERFVAGRRYEEWAYSAGSRVQIMVATQEVGPRYVIPANALIRQGGQAWIFIDEGGEYLRLPVVVESVGSRHAVLPLDCGLHHGDRLVVQGALQLNLSIEQKQGPQAVDPHAGHSH